MGKELSEVNVDEYYKPIKEVFRNYKKEHKDENNAIKLNLSDIKRWLNGVEPKRISVLIFGLIMGMSIDEVENLIKKGKSETGINYKDIEESALAHCIKNQLSYSEYVKIVDEVKKYVKENIATIMENLNSNERTTEFGNSYNVINDSNYFIKEFIGNISYNITTIKSEILDMVKECESCVLSGLYNKDEIKDLKRKRPKVENSSEFRKGYLEYIKHNPLYQFLHENPRILIFQKHIETYN